jgi:hypothetical protein
VKRPGFYVGNTYFAYRRAQALARARFLADEQKQRIPVMEINVEGAPRIAAICWPEPTPPRSLIETQQRPLHAEAL